MHRPLPFRFQANTSFAAGGGTQDRHGSFFTLHGQSYFACNDRSHGGGSGFRSTIIAYAHYRANGTIAPVRIDETGVGNYNISATLAAGLKVWTIEAEDYYAGRKSPLATKNLLEDTDGLR